MRETRPSGSEGGARFNPLSLPLSEFQLHGSGLTTPKAGCKPVLRLRVAHQLLNTPICAEGLSIACCGGAGWGNPTSASFV